MTTINQFKPDIVFHPGETLAEKLRELTMGPKEFAVRTGKPEKTIIAIIKGDSSLTSEMAVLFESVLKIPANFWLKKQFRYDEYKAREKRALAIKEAENWAKHFPIADMVKLGWISSKSKSEEKITELLHFFGVSSPNAWEDYFFNQQLKVAFRISLAHTKEPHAISAWIRQGEIQAKKLHCGAYSEAKFKETLKDIKTIMAKQPDDFFEQLQQLCLTCGVKVVHTPCVKKAPLSGATRWIGDNPLIQLTGRYKVNDRFWFTFFHEAGHIILHGKKDIFLEEIEYSETDFQKEEEANNFAIEWTFSKEEEREVLSTNPLTIENIQKFAKTF
ncbi:MAG TPA: ImmA/IrrE family metallo-endopeptidase, partial [Bacteroidales bacterium]|nr:ImmA/IrrE family metallo-endopeptidase [Bacteroidales bacterium]